ncbi:MAG TPA: UDP-N-acetylglucosamine 4,6-dehydratase (inverting) [Flavobacterium sp.]|uniref:UDP-N-acetylglucosamine 4,6-dehydratase (inverting) n=1 Tax=Flavobacterium sp. TaxID=239 RepID=UPI002CC401E2|nr:UDP-N-acetylglucosamine 4,6-dehydratase (inverting) [Flavobacterium sp.]HNP33342.1 UDP-N-acetylglucosamine 4,6-dehydratase (inverting) [Flavobacterium sp.]
MLDNKSILITGGTGSLGKELTKTILRKWPNIKRLIIYSRDEQKQFQMAQEFPETKYPAIRYFIGDVRDLERLKRAFNGIDYVIHAAAMKHVHIAEYNPDECVKTNIGGADNVIKACLTSNVSKVVALSTDKACAPINLYGATKLTSDKLFIAANNIKGHQDIKFSVVRYGNVMGSNGSVIPFFMEKRKEGILPITDPNMTRFNISLEGGVDMVLHALETAWGGELFVPKIPSYKIMDVAKAIGPNCEHKVSGIRPGEKIHEEMITSSDSFTTYDLGKYYVILPQVTTWDINAYIKQFNAKLVPEGFNYTSGENTEWETVESLRSLIKEHLYPDFTV